MGCCLGACSFSLRIPPGLAKAEGITVEALCERFGDDLRLMEDIGWIFETDQELVELTT